MEKEKIKAMLVLDSKLSKKDIFYDARKAILGGIPSIQYREKEKSTKEMLEECIALKKICAEKALFFVNDRADLAFAVGTDGLHLGQDDLPMKKAREILPNAIIGVTVHNAQEAVQAEKDSADYVSVSPVFRTGTKKDAGKEVGLKMIRKVRDAVKIPVMGIGGINQENAREVIQSGADCVSVVSCIVCNDNVFKASKLLMRALK